jgi:methylenetetrahydrofolate dehydrogenase (NADP+) / methenyltetrahydrofolate cyclohydrolase
MGSPLAVSEEFVSVGQVVIDVGISAASGEKMEEEASKRKIVGDVQFEKVKNIVSAISPVPGGVGPMTVASLFQNLLKAYRLQESKSVSPARLQN